MEGEEEVLRDRESLNTTVWSALVAGLWLKQSSYFNSVVVPKPKVVAGDLNSSGYTYRQTVCVWFKEFFFSVISTCRVWSETWCRRRPLSLSTSLQRQRSCGTFMKSWCTGRLVTRPAVRGKVRCWSDNSRKGKSEMNQGEALIRSEIQTVQ